MTRRLVLLRHGRTAWNAENRFQGQADPPLDDVGRAQAWEAAGIVAALRPDLLASSPLVRAAETADIVSHVTGLPVVTDRRLRERGLGQWEGRTLDEVAAEFPDEYAAWASGHDVRRRGGETRDEVAVRTLDALADLPEVPVTVLVFHGASAMALTNALLDLPQHTHRIGPLANCHWTELVTEPAPDGGTRWRLRGHNLGAPGAVVPVPAVRAGGAESTSDADA